MPTSEANSYAHGSIPGWTFGDKIRKARDIAGMDQKSFASAININASSLAAYETGRSNPRFKDAPQIAKSIQMLTGIPREWFLVEDFEMNSPTPPGGGASVTESLPRDTRLSHIRPALTAIVTEIRPVDVPMEWAA